MVLANKLSPLEWFSQRTKSQSPSSIFVPYGKNSPYVHFQFFTETSVRDLVSVYIYQIKLQNSILFFKDPICSVLADRGEINYIIPLTRR